MANFSPQLVRNMLSGSLATVVNMGVMAVTYPLFLHYLGLETFGLWLLLSTLLAFSRLSDLGIGLAVAKIVAELRGGGECEEIRSLIGTALVVITFTAFIPLLFLALYPATIVQWMGVTANQGEALTPLLPWMGLLCLLGLYGDVLLASVTGMRRSDLSNAFQSLGKMAMAAVAALLLFYGWGLLSLLVATAVMQLVWMVTSIAFLWRQGITPAFNSVNRNCLRRLLTFGRDIFAGNLFGLLLYPFSAWMLARFAGPSAIPLFDVAFRGSMQVRSLLESALRALMTEMSTRQGLGEPVEQIWALTRKITRKVIVIALPLYLLLGLGAPLFLETWLGKGFDPEMVPVFRTALLASLISLFGVPTYYLAMGLGRVGLCLRERMINATGSMVALTLTLLFTGTLSAQTAADAMLFSFSLSLAYLIGSTRSFLLSLKEKVT